MTDAPMIVSNFKRVGKGSLVGIFDLEVPRWHLKILGVKLMRKGTSEWVSLPQREWTGRDGAKKYDHFLTFTDDDTSARFYGKALEAVTEIAGGDHASF